MANTHSLTLTNLSSDNILNGLINNDSTVLDEETQKLYSCEIFIIVFNFNLIGLSSVFKEWIDKIFSRYRPLDSKFSLLVSYTNFPQENFMPNALHKSTIKRRLHYVNWVTLKDNMFIPNEPLVFYDFGKYKNSFITNKFTVDSFKIITNTSKVEEKDGNSQNFLCENNNFMLNEKNINDKVEKENKSFDTKISPIKRAKTFNSKPINDFLFMIVNSIKNIESLENIDLTEL